MLRRSVWVSVMMISSSVLLLSGCAEQGPKPGGVTTVAPATKPGTPATTPPAADKPAEETKPAAPADAGSTTGGGTETPSTPGNGQ